MTGAALCRALSLAAVMLAAGTLPSLAAETVKIGVIYPLTGNSASAGQAQRDAVISAPISSTTPIPN